MLRAPDEATRMSTSIGTVATEATADTGRRWEGEVAEDTRDTRAAAEEGGETTPAPKTLF
jgi:hypothetical protein